jgi:hypothetical protein
VQPTGWGEEGERKPDGDGSGVAGVDIGDRGSLVAAVVADGQGLAPSPTALLPSSRLARKQSREASVRDARNRSCRMGRMFKSWRVSADVRASAAPGSLHGL